MRLRPRSMWMRLAGRAQELLKAFPRSQRDVLSTECRCERAMGRARADDDRRAGVDVVATCEGESEARKWRPAPARRRSSGMRAERRVDRAGDCARDDGSRRPELGGVALRSPVEDEVR